MPTQPAFAHFGPPRLELQYDNVPPGTPFEVRGINLVAETSIALVLAGAEQPFTLAVAYGDEHGDFVQVVELPVEATAGDYVLQAVVDSFVLVTAPLKIVGQASGEEETFRDEEEPLLVPLPAGWQSSVIPAPIATSAAAAAQPQPGIQIAPPLIVGALLFLMLAGVVVGLRARGAGVATVTGNMNGNSFPS